MRTFNKLLYLFGVCAALHCSAKTMELEDLFKPDSIAGAELSPNGDYIAFKYPSKDRIDAIIWDLEKNDAQKLKGSNSDDVNTIHWVSDELVAFNLLLKNKYAGGLFVAKAGSRKVRMLNQYDGLGILEPLPGDESLLLTRLYSTVSGNPRTVNFNAKNGHTRKLDSADQIGGKQLSWWSDGKGDLACSVIYKEGEIDVYYHDEAKGTWHLFDKLNDVGTRYETLGYDR
ncbi:MAG: hypothetical protein ACPGN3_03700 [Opitutales bacterium]